jgi:hypothetical protein
MPAPRRQLQRRHAGFAPILRPTFHDFPDGLNGLKPGFELLPGGGG